MSITAEAIRGFTIGLLASKYDNPKPIPPFHVEMWELCCSDAPKVAIAAPRSHAKSTAITHAYILAKMLFGDKDFCLLVSDTEGQAVEFLGDIKVELEENETLRKTFGIVRLLKSTETDVICLVKLDGQERRFRILAKGSEQKVRGLKWRGKRPDLIVGDDLENDEIVMNPERREKFRKWLMKALIPCGSDTCSVRIVGTILHLDSALQRLIEDKTWKHLFYEAEDGNFQNILWPEQFSEQRLRDIYESFAEQNDTEGYSQEYRNRPVAVENAFFNKDYFYDFDRDANGKAIIPNLEMYAAADFAISEKEKADFNCHIAGGMDPDGYLWIRDVKVFKTDADGIIKELLLTQRHWKPNIFTFETEKIDKALAPALNRAMREGMKQHKIPAGIYLNIVLMTPSRSIIMRATSIQAMHKAGMIKYDHQASWYKGFREELDMVGPSGPRGKHDDQFSAFGFLGMTIDQFYEAATDDEIEEEEYQHQYEQHHGQGQNATTGY